MDLSEATEDARAKTIALFLPSLLGGGAERVMVTLANGLADGGHQVDLVLVQKRGPYLAFLHPAVRVVDLNCSRTIFALVPLALYLRRENPHALLSAMNHANVIAILAKGIARPRTRLVVAEHNTLTTDIGAAKALMRRALPWLMKKTYPRADAVVVVSDGVAADLAAALELDLASIHTIFNPVVTNELEARSHESVQHPWLGRSNAPLILAVGRLSEQKDFASLIEAFNHLRKATSARLAILGEGKQQALLESLICASPYKDEILLGGFQANPYGWMRRAKVFVLSSRWEGLPTVLIEAMACGTPVVSTACPSGPQEILEEGRWGRLVPVGDARAMAAAINAALNDPSPPDVRRRASDFRVERAVQEYSRVLGIS